MATLKRRRPDIDTRERERERDRRRSKRKTISKSALWDWMEDEGYAGMVSKTQFDEWVKAEETGEEGFNIIDRKTYGTTTKTHTKGDPYGAFKIYEEGAKEFIKAWLEEEAKVMETGKFKEIFGLEEDERSSKEILDDFGISYTQPAGSGTTIFIDLESIADWVDTTTDKILAERPEEDVPAWETITETAITERPMTVSERMEVLQGVIPQEDLLAMSYEDIMGYDMPSMLEEAEVTREIPSGIAEAMAGVSRREFIDYIGADLYEGMVSVGDFARSQEIPSQAIYDAIKDGILGPGVAVQRGQEEGQRPGGALVNPELALAQWDARTQQFYSEGTDVDPMFTGVVTKDLETFYGWNATTIRNIAETTPGFMITDAQGDPVRLGGSTMYDPTIAYEVYQKIQDKGPVISETKARDIMEDRFKLIPGATTASGALTGEYQAKISAAFTTGAIGVDYEDPRGRMVLESDMDAYWQAQATPSAETLPAGLGFDPLETYMTSSEMAQHMGWGEGLTGKARTAEIQKQRNRYANVVTPIEYDDQNMWPLAQVLDAEQGFAEWDAEKHLFQTASKFPGDIGDADIPEEHIRRLPGGQVYYETKAVWKMWEPVTARYMPGLLEGDEAGVPPVEQVQKTLATSELHIQRGIDRDDASAFIDKMVDKGKLTPGLYGDEKTYDPDEVIALYDEEQARAPTFSKSYVMKTYGLSDKDVREFFSPTDPDRQSGEPYDISAGDVVQWEEAERAKWGPTPEEWQDLPFLEAEKLQAGVFQKGWYTSGELRDRISQRDLDKAVKEGLIYTEQPGGPGTERRYFFNDPRTLIGLPPVRVEEEEGPTGGILGMGGLIGMALEIAEEAVGGLVGAAGEGRTYRRDEVIDYLKTAYNYNREQAERLIESGAIAGTGEGPDWRLDLESPIGAAMEGWEGPPTKLTTQDIPGVKGVIDGDTITLDNNESVRYLGINTPELGQRGWTEFREANKEFIDQYGDELQLSWTGMTDDYGRVLGDPVNEAGMSAADYINNAMIDVGPSDPELNTYFKRLISSAGQGNTALAEQTKGLIIDRMNFLGLGDDEWHSRGFAAPGEDTGKAEISPYKIADKPLKTMDEVIQMGNTFFMIESYEGLVGSADAVEQEQATALKAALGDLGIDADDAIGIGAADRGGVMGFLAGIVENLWYLPEAPGAMPGVHGIAIGDPLVVGQVDEGTVGEEIYGREAPEEPIQYQDPLSGTGEGLYIDDTTNFTRWLQAANAGNDTRRKEIEKTWRATGINQPIARMTDDQVLQTIESDSVQGWLAKQEGVVRDIYYEPLKKVWFPPGWPKATETERIRAGEYDISEEVLDVAVRFVPFVAFGAVYRAVKYYAYKKGLPISKIPTSIWGAAMSAGGFAFGKGKAGKATEREKRLFERFKEETGFAEATHEDFVAWKETPGPEMSPEFKARWMETNLDRYSNIASAVESGNPIPENDLEFLRQVSADPDFVTAAGGTLYTDVGGTLEVANQGQVVSRITGDVMPVWEYDQTSKYRPLGIPAGAEVVSEGEVADFMKSYGTGSPDIDLPLEDSLRDIVAYRSEHPGAKTIPPDLELAFGDAFEKASWVKQVDSARAGKATLVGEVITNLNLGSPPAPGDAERLEKMLRMQIQAYGMHLSANEVEQLKSMGYSKVFDEWEDIPWVAEAQAWVPTGEKVEYTTLEDLYDMPPVRGPQRYTPSEISEIRTRFDAGLEVTDIEKGALHDAYFGLPPYDTDDYFIAPTGAKIGVSAVDIEGIANVLVQEQATAEDLHAVGLALGWTGEDVVNVAEATGIDLTEMPTYTRTGGVDEFIINYDTEVRDLWTLSKTFGPETALATEGQQAVYDSIREMVVEKITGEPDVPSITAAEGITDITADLPMLTDAAPLTRADSLRSITTAGIGEVSDEVRQAAVAELDTMGLTGEVAEFQYRVDLDVVAELEGDILAGAKAITLTGDEATVIAKTAAQHEIDADILRVVATAEGWSETEARGIAGAAGIDLNQASDAAKGWKPLPGKAGILSYADDVSEPWLRKGLSFAKDIITSPAGKKIFKYGGTALGFILGPLGYAEAGTWVAESMSREQEAWNYAAEHDFKFAPSGWLVVPGQVAGTFDVIPHTTLSMLGWDAATEMAAQYAGVTESLWSGGGPLGGLDVMSIAGIPAETERNISEWASVYGTQIEEQRVLRAQWQATKADVEIGYGGELKPQFEPDWYYEGLPRPEGQAQLIDPYTGADITPPAMPEAIGPAPTDISPEPIPPVPSVGAAPFVFDFAGERVGFDPEDYVAGTVFETPVFEVDAVGAGGYTGEKPSYTQTSGFISPSEFPGALPEWKADMPLPEWAKWDLPELGETLEVEPVLSARERIRASNEAWRASVAYIREGGRAVFEPDIGTTTPGQVGRARGVRVGIIDETTNPFGGMGLVPDISGSLVPDPRIWEIAGSLQAQPAGPDVPKLRFGSIDFQMRPDSLVRGIDLQQTLFDWSYSGFGGGAGTWLSRPQTQPQTIPGETPVEVSPLSTALNRPGSNRPWWEDWGNV